MGDGSMTVSAGRRRHSVIAAPAAVGAALAVASVLVHELRGGAPLLAPLLTAPVYAVTTRLPALRIADTEIVSPRAWLLYVGGLQLVLVPLIITWTGVAQYTLPHLPDPGRMEQALLLQLAAFVAAAVVVAAPRPPPRAAPATTRWWRTPSLPVLAGLALVGLAGVAIKFRTPAALLDYLRGAYVRGSVSDQGPSLIESLGSVLLPFLSFAAALTVLRILGQRGARRSRRIPALAAALGFLLFATLLFDYNRASLVVPLVALVGAHLRTVPRLPLRLLIGVGVAAVGLIVLVGAIRSASNAAGLASQGLGGDGRVPLGVAELQTYASGPQFLGWALQHPPPEQPASVVLSSIVYAAPKVGTGFRDGSGPVLYNRSVYGDDRARDLIVPFQAELFWDLGVPGLVLGFLGVGLLIRRCDDGYRREPSVVGAYVWMFLGIWSCFLLLGSVAIVTQIALYTAAPIWLFCLGTAALNGERAVTARAAAPC